MPNRPPEQSGSASPFGVPELPDPPGPASRTPARSAHPAPAPSSPAEFLAHAAPGTRVVARYRITGGFTDALGYLESSDDRSCVIVTRRGPATVDLAAVVAAKAVPEPPARRGRPSAEPSIG